MEILECLQFGNSHKKYSPTVRIFCFTLHYYSPKAYEYIRSVFDSHLPNPRTLRYWMSAINTSPGFTECAFDALREKVEKARENGKNLIGGLIFDEMFIRRHSQWDKAKKEYLGHISAGKPVEYDEFSPLAKEALLMMISGINEEFKIPIAYFFTCGLCAEEKVAILNEAMRELSKTGIKLASMTSDGYTANISAYKKLGANFKIDQPYFVNPYDAENKVYVVLDPPHMLKLIRNCIGRFQEKDVKLLDNQGNSISFQFIINLVELQSSMGINLGNKLTKSHAEFRNNKMKVRIAAQTISKSSAASIEFLDLVMKHENFSNSTGTTQFLRTFDSLFDIMNSKKGHTDDKFKRPICAENINDITIKFNHDKEYIRGLRMIENGEIVPILNTNSYTPFFGFNHNMTSVLGIYHDYIVPQSSEIDDFFIFSISQDHVESTFGCVRQMGGNNCNPNAQQFEAAYRKLLVQNDIKSSIDSNCQNDVTKFLNVSSGAKSMSASANPVELKMLSTYDNEFLIQSHEEEDGLRNHSKAYLASELEKKINRKIELKGSQACAQCLNIFEENDRINDVFVQFLSQNKKVQQPCKSTVHIIGLVDSILEKYDSLDISYASMLAYIFEQTSLLTLFESSEFGEQHNHKFDFVKLLIETYLDMKCTNVSRIVTRWSQKKVLRHHNLKEVHREGQ